MAFSALCVLAVLAVALGAEYDLNFVEKGGDYTEKITIDKNTQIVETDVPQHAGVESSKYLTDYKMGLTVMKVDRLEKCYAMTIPADENTPEEIELGLKKLHNKFPHQKYWVENTNILPVAEMESSSLSKAIINFCGVYPIIKVLVSDEKNMEKFALAAAKATKTKRSKRAVIVTEFIACDRASQFTIAKCMDTPGNNLMVICKFVKGKTCVYKVGCHLSSTGWNCPGKHSFTIVNCCDYKCN